jgi:hypothetical protein
MISLSALRKARVACLVGAFAVSACGGGAPTAAPSTTVGSPAAPSVAASPPPATTAPVVTVPPASDAPATAEPGVDPSAELEIAAPYTLAPLDEALAGVFVEAMRSSLGEMSGVFDVGVRSAVKKGATTSWIIVMRFPELGLEPKTLLDLAAQGATGGSSVDVEKQTIGGKPVRIIEAQGSALTITVVGSSDLVMVIPLVGGRQEAIAVITALIDAN